VTERVASLVPNPELRGAWGSRGGCSQSVQCDWATKNVARQERACPLEEGCDRSTGTMPDWCTGLAGQCRPAIVAARRRKVGSSYEESSAMVIQASLLPRMDGCMSESDGLSAREELPESGSRGQLVAAR
jgi:hypothetical protein